MVADLQREYAEAIRRGRVWRSRWILLGGYVVFLKTIALCGAEAVRQALRGWTVDDRSAMSRTLGFSAAAMAVATMALITWFCYYALLWTGRAAALQEALPAFAGAWLPNVVFAVVSVALLKSASPPGGDRVQPTLSRMD